MKIESTSAEVRETDHSTIEAELSRLLSERRFAGAPQMSAFLRYIITQTLAGNADRIKAYSVGVDALGKPDSFDAQNDPSVRVLALRLRKTLAAIYASGAPAHARVELKVGTYVPEFFKASSTDGNNSIETPAATLSQAGSAAVVSSAQSFEALAINHNADEETSRFMVGSSMTDSTAESANQESISSKSGFVKLSMGAIVLLAALWQLGGNQFVDERTPMVSFASVTPVNLQALEYSPKAGAAASTIPTLYLYHDAGQTEFEQQLSVLLGSSFVRAGTVNVIKPMADPSIVESPSGSYQLILSELAIQGQSRVETQVVSLDTGEVLMASTVVIEKFNDELSASELKSIESIASSISSVNGPVYRDYCQRFSSEDSVDCMAG